MKRKRGGIMPRRARQKSSTKVYHVILRGNAKQDIFLEKQDYAKFMEELSKTKEKYEHKIYAYCLMPNHIHLIIYDEKDNLSIAMQSLAVSYSSYWNKKYERVGHLFQNRFLSKAVETESYLKTLCRYIHQNPSISGISKTEEYPWSSYQEYAKDREGMVDKKQIVTLFGRNKQEVQGNFIQFHKYKERQEDIKDFAEYEMIEKLSDEQARKYIEEILKIDNIQEIIQYSVAKRKEYLKKLKEIQGISKTQVSRLTGLSKRMIEVAMK